MNPESVPTTLLSTALAPHVRGMAASKWGLVLRIIPQATGGYPFPSPDAWYDAVWSIPARCSHPHDVRPDCLWAYVDAQDEGFTHVGWHDIATAGTLPAPPVVPFETRLAETPEVTEADIDALEKRQPGAIKFMGDRDGIRKWFESERRAAVHADTTATRYDWDAQAQRVIDLYRSLTPPSLSPAERIMTVGARIQRAREEEEAAKMSARDLIRNAHNANAGTDDYPQGRKADWAKWVGVSRPTIDSWLS